MLMFVKSHQAWYQVLSCEPGYGVADPVSGQELAFTIDLVEEDDIPVGARFYPGRGPASLAVQRVVGPIKGCVLA